MPVHIALLRGINVGGKAIIRMADLRLLLRELGFEAVATYVQSGNVVLASPMTPAAVGRRITAAMEPAFGISPRVIVRSLDQWRKLVAGNPMREAALDPTKLHAFLLDRMPSPDSVAALERADRGSERFVFADGVLYLHALEGFGRSKLAAAVERILQVPATSRNWRTVTRLEAMAGEAASI